MVDVSCEIDGAAVARLEEMLDRVARESPGTLARELKRAGIYICGAFKKRAKVAKNNVRAYPNEYRAVPSPVPPRYIHSNSRGHRLLRRWQLTRKLGTPDVYTKQHFVYTNAHRGKGGKMVGKSAAQEKRELLRLHGGIPRAGLAKKSWGWIARDIGGTGAETDLTQKARKGVRRDPRQYAKGMFQRFANAAEVRISNRLDYALDALPAGALDAGLTAAVNRLEHNINHHIVRATA